MILFLCLRVQKSIRQVFFSLRFWKMCVFINQKLKYHLYGNHYYISSRNNVNMSTFDTFLPMKLCMFLQYFWFLPNLFPCFLCPLFFVFKSECKCGNSHGCVTLWLTFLNIVWGARVCACASDVRHIMEGEIRYQHPYLLFWNGIISLP